MRTKKNSLRLPGYDYSQPGFYFITISTKNNEHLFGAIQDGEMTLSNLGNIVQESWYDLPNHYRCQLGESVIMPNHFHGILILPSSPSSVRAGFKPARTEEGEQHSISEIIRGSKTFSARKVNIIRKTPGITVWHRGFHDHIIRGSYTELNNIRRYIIDNPKRWDQDRFYFRKE